jgi:hypothetical protein
MGGVGQVVASAQQTVARSTTEQPFEADTVGLPRKKGRDGASFGGVLEAQTGQMHFYCALSNSAVCFWCAVLFPEVGRRVTLWQSAITFNDLR